MLTILVNGSNAENAELWVRYEIDNSIQEVFLSTRFIGIETNNGERRIGSGVIVHEDGWLVTAKHVIDVSPQTIKSTAIFGPNNEKAIIGSVTASLQYDVCLLKLEQISGRSFPAKISQKATDVLYIGRDVGFIGWKIIQDTPRPIVKKGNISATHPDGIHFFIDGNILEGDSGGPVYDLDTGELIGIMVAVQPQMFEFDYPHKFPPDQVSILKILKKYPNELLNPLSNSRFSLTVWSSVFVSALVLPTIYIKPIMIFNHLIQLDQLN